MASPSGDRGYASVLERIEGGTSVTPIFKVKKDGKLQLKEYTLDEKKGIKMVLPVLDLKATWDSISDDVLKENWRNAIRQSARWAREAGDVWYEDLLELSTNLARKYKKPFKEKYGLDLTPELVAGMMSSYSTNNSWAGNLVGVQVFLSETFKNEVPSVFKRGAVDPKAIHFQNEDWGVKPLLQYLKAGKGSVIDYFAENASAPKPYNFVMSILGKADAATVDRWVARIMLNTDDFWIADAMWGFKTKDLGRVGFDRMKQILVELSQEPEFAGLTAFDVQAIPWIHVVGPDGALARLDLGVLAEAAAADEPNLAVAQALREEGIRRGWFDEEGVPFEE
jgi:hypothetical protein